ncbi:hypothetical protein ACIQUS_19085 [Pseudomonas sp. NPDC090755]|uniref:hypothetical protein n=1 Tax=Pseudomonas sp. NPDC090755 TaxID=3364481 RepID=UPI00383ADF46
MTTNAALDKTWQTQASSLPEALLSAMASGLDTGALSLSPAHVRSLNAYVAYAGALPGSPAGISQWIGAGGGALDSRILDVYFSALSPELSNNSMVTFFRQVKSHATSWEVLFEKNLQLADILATVAGNINRSGAVILDVCAHTKALGKQREAWDALLDGKLLPLSAADRTIVTSLPNQMTKLKGQLKEYTRQLERVRVESNRFRDEARLQIIPAVTRKVNAFGRSNQPTTPFLIGAKLALARMQTRTRELSEKLQNMEQLLRDVLTASSHVHSAWQSLTAYIDASNDQLQRITTGQQLARFAIYFGRFVGLWKTIEQSASQMGRTLAQYQR